MGPNFDILKATITTALTAALALMLSLAMPLSAIAAEPALENPSVDITAQVQTTGTMHIIEHRVFAFNGEYDTLRWSFTGFPEDAKINVSSVRMAKVNEENTVEGDWITLSQVTFNSDWREAVKDSGGNMKKEYADSQTPQKTGESAPVFPADNSWALDDRQHALYAFFQPTTNRTIFEIDYSVENAIAAYDDVAEIYWDYAPARNDTETHNLIATVQLPVPESATITPDKTVLAWGHGAIGEFDIGTDGTITYKVPYIPKGQYANAHIIFPVTWLPNLTVEAKQAYSGTRLDNARTEEESWTDTWSNNVVNTLSMNIAALAVCAAALIASGATYMVLGREKHRDKLPALTDAEIASITSDSEMLARFNSWNHIAENEINPDNTTKRLQEANLFDMRSFKAQKVLAIVALVFIALSAIAAIVFGNWLTFAAFLITGICIGVCANYIPRRTPKGTALALALENATDQQSAKLGDS